MQNLRTKMKKRDLCQQHVVFPDGQVLCSMQLNFSDWMRTGDFCMIYGR